MIRPLIRFLVLLAVLALPLGMAPAGATADHHTMAGAMDGAAHCADMAPGGRQMPAKSMGGDCAMACASALPAFARATDDLPAPQPVELARPGLAAVLHGLILDIATPPPRFA